MKKYIICLKTINYVSLEGIELSFVFQGGNNLNFTYTDANKAVLAFNKINELVLASSANFILQNLIIDENGNLYQDIIKEKLIKL